jgi:hypothetical protein
MERNYLAETAARFSINWRQSGSLRPLLPRADNFLDMFGILFGHDV